MPLRFLVILASLLGLALTRGAANTGVPVHEVPALGAGAVLKIRIFYGGLLLAAVASLLPAVGEVPLYLVTALFLGGFPVLGHQTIGLTPARGRSVAIRRLWLLGLAFPLLVLTLGAVIIADATR